MMMSNLARRYRVSCRQWVSRFEAFPSAVDFLASPNVHHTSCLIVDVHMPRMTGTELHSRLVGSGYDIPTILITAYPDDSARVGLWVRASLAT